MLSFADIGRWRIVDGAHDGASHASAGPCPNLNPAGRGPMEYATVLDLLTRCRRSVAGGTDSPGGGTIDANARSLQKRRDRVRFDDQRIVAIPRRACLEGPSSKADPEASSLPSLSLPPRRR